MTRADRDGVIKFPNDLCYMYIWDSYAVRQLRTLAVSPTYFYHYPSAHMHSIHLLETV